MAILFKTAGWQRTRRKHRRGGAAASWSRGRKKRNRRKGSGSGTRISEAEKDDVMVITSRFGDKMKFTKTTEIGGGEGSSSSMQTSPVAGEGEGDDDQAAEGWIKEKKLSSAALSAAASSSFSSSSFVELDSQGQMSFRENVGQFGSRISTLPHNVAGGGRRGRQRPLALDAGRGARTRHRDCGVGLDGERE